jgi:hypothetical protein
VWREGDSAYWAGFGWGFGLGGPPNTIGFGEIFIPTTSCGTDDTPLFYHVFHAENSQNPHTFYIFADWLTPTLLQI